MPISEEKNPKGLRVIKTARDVESINKAADEGFRPLMKKVEPDPKINFKYAIYQNSRTGRIKVAGDYRERGEGGEWDEVIGWTRYYPFSFPLPYAAYLIPKDIRRGEYVFVEDVIEDLIGGVWNQGDAWRLASCEARWDGHDLIMQYEFEKDCQVSIG